MSDGLTTALTRAKTEYLDKHRISIRTFAAEVDISRTRLMRLFEGTEIATVREFVIINDRINMIEKRRVERKNRKEKSSPISGETFSN